MKNLKKITSFALALFVAGSLCISTTNVQAKTIISGTTLVAYAKQFIGTPYKSGGTTTAGFDCSGFTMYIYNHFNIKLPRIAKAQTTKGIVVSKSNLRAGDLVFFGNPIYHVGMYVGDGKFVHSPKPGSAVTIIELKYMPGYNTARRITS